MKKYNLFVATIFALTLLSATSLKAQDDAFSKLKSFATHIVQFNNSCPQEKVFLHFDNEAYYLGETIWFSAYVATAPKIAPVAALNKSNSVSIKAIDTLYVKSSKKSFGLFS